MNFLYFYNYVQNKINQISKNNQFNTKMQFQLMFFNVLHSQLNRF